MKKIITATIFSFFILGSAAANAANLTGAFGYNVGTKINTAQLQPLQDNQLSGLSVNAGGDAYKVYSLIPLDQDKTFQNHVAIVDNKTSVLTGIQAVNKYGSAKACADNLPKITGPLAKQYGSNTKVNTATLFYVLDNSTMNSLSMGCSANGDLNLSITNLSQAQ